MNIADKVIQLKNDFDEVHESGKQEQHDEFWNKLQRNGKLENYSNVFAGAWLPSMFYPKYNMTPTRTDNMFGTFDNAYNMYEPVLDLVERLNECGVVLDTSKATNVNDTFIILSSIVR